VRFPGRITKDGKFWIVEIPAFDASTQGRTKREAFAMAEDLIETMADVKGFRASVYPVSGDAFELGANRTGVLLALLLRRQREHQGLTLAEAAERLGQRSKNAYARYEQGKSMPTVEKLEQLLEAVAPNRKIVWHFAA
jgi:Helix-turn-helix domain